tara:strand:- start:1696 stop:2232 length:537 start_codon:yes stop_codon:yes gene_type:complete
MVKTIKIKRKMSDEQRAAAAERLAKARAAKQPSKNLTADESIRDLPDDHALSPKKVKEWIKEQKTKVSSMRSMKDSKDGKDRGAYFVEEGYLHNLQNYLRTGTYTDSRYGANRQKLIKLRCVNLAYDKDGMVKRTVGVFYPDIGCEWTVEMDIEYYGRRKVPNKGKVYKASGKRSKRA